MRDHVVFAPNVPQTVSLMFQEGRQLENGNWMFTLQDQRVMFVAPEVKASLDALQLQPGEQFTICKRWNGEKGRRSITRWDVWLHNETEKSRAAAEAPELERQLQASLDAVAGRKSAPGGRVLPMPTPPVELAPTGTDGATRAIPQPQQAPILPQVVATRLPPNGKIPFNQAFTQVVALVNDGLKSCGEVWNDGPKQDIVSTILIAASNMGWLSLWERPEKAA